jgi:large subunit ribosomal protein LP2
MRYLAAYLLSTLAENPNPTVNDVKKILNAAGVEIEQANLDKVFAELKGKDVNELIAEGQAKLASVSVGVAAGGAAGGAAAAGGDSAPAAEEKAEEKEESDEDMGFGLFD